MVSQGHSTPPHPHRSKTGSRGFFDIGQPLEGRVEHCGEQGDADRPQ